MAGYGGYFQPRIEQMGQYNPRTYSLVGGRPSAKQIKYAASVAAGAAIAGALGYGAKKYHKKGGTRYLRKRNTLPKVNKKRISYLNKKMANNEATIEYRDRIVSKISVGGVNQCVYADDTGLSKGVLETAITNLKFFDPATPATLVTVDYNSGTFQKQILLKSRSVLTVRNNYAVPAKVQIYLCRIKSDTNQSPKACITQGFADIGALSNTNPLSKARDSKILTDLWNIKSMRKDIVLQAGKEFKCYHSEKEFSYDTSLVDTHDQQYIKIFKSHVWLMRVEGVLGHDSIAEQQGFQQGGIDVCVDRIINIKYDGGVDLYEVHTANDSATFTNTPQTTVLDNEQQNFKL